MRLTEPAFPVIWNQCLLKYSTDDTLKPAWYKGLRPIQEVGVLHRSPQRMMELGDLHLRAGP